MNDRERFVNTMHFEPVDRLPIWDFGFWAETLDEWRQQGLPEGVNTNEFFGMDQQMNEVPVSLGMIPAFEEIIIEDNETTQVVRDASGATYQRKKVGASIPHFIDFPIKTRADFEAMKERYNPDDPRRYPADWAERVKALRTRDYPMGISTGGFFGWVRNWMGLENTCMCFHDDPQLMHDMMNFIADFVCRTIERALSEVELDYSSFWEDMAYNKASLISPRMFRDFMIEPYQKITRLLAAHGVDVNIVDCDGTIDELVPLFFEGGVNCMFPLEVGVWNASAVEMAKRFDAEYRQPNGKPYLLMIGNIDKHALARDRAAIEHEVFSKIPVLAKRGGYIPTVDHRVPPDVPLANYQYYLELLRQVAGG